MASARLPGKVLADIAGRPMLWHVVWRTRRAETLHKVIVATSQRSTDDAVANFCADLDVDCFRGSEDDVLDRYYRAASHFGAETIVRITADCPLIDPTVIDKVVSCFLTGEHDYVTNTLRYTYPDGLDTEVFSFSALAQAWEEAGKPTEREHVTPYMRFSGKFRTQNVENEVDLSSRNLRWTVDELADLEFVRNVFEALAKRPDFGMNDVFALLEEIPDVRNMQNQPIMYDSYYRALYSQAREGAAPKLPLGHSQAWFSRAQKIIPGCAQTFSKSYTQYVHGVAPIFLQRGKGCRVWDVDGNEYVDYVQGLLPNILGYAHEEVTAAVTTQLAEGHSFSLPHPLEVQLAERLIWLIPCAEMVRFGKNGSDATAGAVRAARAYTKRELIACCGYHGWQDWFIGSTTRNAGVPESVQALTYPFPYNDLSALEQVLDKHSGKFAAVIMEPMNFYEPTPGYLQEVKNLVHKHGALLIFDEITSGFHFGLGGAQKRYGVVPDLACFGKAMANGFPISCVVGRADIMRIFEEVFFSFTFAGEVASMAAAMKVLDVLESTDALARMEAKGRRLQDGFNVLATQAGLADQMQCIGHPNWTLLKLMDAKGNNSALVRSLFIQEVNKRGILSLAVHNMTAAHDDSAIEQTLEVYATVLKTLAGWLDDRQPARFLEGPEIQPVFKVR